MNCSILDTDYFKLVIGESIVLTVSKTIAVTKKIRTGSKVICSVSESIYPPLVTSIVNITQDSTEANGNFNLEVLLVKYE